MASFIFKDNPNQSSILMKTGDTSQNWQPLL